jgi:hypothetical protein
VVDTETAAGAEGLTARRTGVVVVRVDRHRSETLREWMGGEETIQQSVSRGCGRIGFIRRLG